MTSKKILFELHEKILNMLKEKLPVELTYHTYDHTIDVMEAAEQIAKAEKVDEDDLILLKTAAVFHDIGYIYTRENHEQESCSIARELLASIGIENKYIEKVCELILATKIPQNPKNKLSEIICDADLDYLGREDYFPISQNMFNEFKYFGIVNNKNEWKNLQIRFLESHNYFTQTSISTRKDKKEENLKLIRNS